MEQKSQTPFIVERDGEIDTELSVLPPTGIEAATEQVSALYHRFTGHLALQTRMLVFDTMHGTHYRRIRNQLVEQQKRERFEHSIGLVAIDKK